MFLKRPSERFSCVLCGQREFCDLGSVGAYWRQTRAVACVRCGLMCLNPRWTDREYGTYYERYYYDTYHRSSLGLAQLGDALQPRTESIVRLAGVLLSERSALARVVEIGCGRGTNLVAMMTLHPGYTYVGLEPDASIAAALQTRHPHLTVLAGTLSSTVEQLDSLGPFDLVIMSHVLEHFANPVEALRLVRKLLAPGGHVLCVVPDAGTMTPFHEQFTVPHTHYFTRRTLQAVQGAAAFQITALASELTDEICAVSSATVGEQQWDGTSDFDFVLRRLHESGRLRAILRTAGRRTVESVLSEPAVHRLQKLMRSWRRE